MEGEGDEEIEGVRFREKESDPSNGMFISERDWRVSSQQVVSDTLVRSEPPPIIPFSTSDDTAFDLVEELTLNSNLVVSSSNDSREGIQMRQGQWKHLYQLAGGLGSASASSHHCENVSKDKEKNTTYGGGGGGGMENALLPEFGIQSTLQQSNQQSPVSFTGIRTKVLSSSGFPQFLVRNSLKGKGVAYRYPENRDGVTSTGQKNEKSACVSRKGSDAPLDLGAKVTHPSIQNSVDGDRPDSFLDGILLREWFKPGRKVNRAESLHIFKQIVQLVDLAHSQQVALQDVKPARFKLLPSNQVIYVGSFAKRDLSESVMDLDVPSLANHLSRKRFLQEDLRSRSSLNSKQQKLTENLIFTTQQRQSSAGSGYKCERAKEVDINSRYDISQRLNLDSEHRLKKKSGRPVVSNTAEHLPANFQLEDKWYTSPEEHNERGSTFSSNIYSLGVLLFELFFSFESWEVHSATMLNLRHRILPPNFLSEYPKEVGFCLWLLHPEPSSRPTTREVLHSELICEPREVSKDQLPLPADEDHTESELLLHFLISLKEHKHKHASKLVEDIECIEADIEEVQKRHLLRTTEVLSWKHRSSSNTREFLLKEPSTPEAFSRLTTVSNTSQTRLMRNINQLESAYFSMRSQIQLPNTDETGRSDKDLLKNRERRFRVKNENDGDQKPSDRLGIFFDGLCKYARYNKFELRGTLRNGDLLNSANVICSLSFDRDEEYFAAAGVSKKIKIFDFKGLLNDSIDIHYPVVEMTSRSKLSCVSWNSYIKNYLAATDYDGVVQLWDATTGQRFSQYTDHEKRAWSVDFSQVDPTKLASGSDDCSVKLWSINERKCISTIWSDANVCCVQFSADSNHLLAFGSADYKTYCYDLRNTKKPWCTLTGHGKTVSDIKFLDSETLISASTDNTLKLWDLNKTSCSGLSTNACSLTFRGHINEKNFVGLSVSDGYIVCGSESNEVYAYHRSLPMPITSHKFGSIDPISGQENGDDNGQFVSSVCWKGKSDMVVAANSSGSIKLLQMV